MKLLALFHYIVEFKEVAPHYYYYYLKTIVTCQEVHNTILHIFSYSLNFSSSLIQLHFFPIPHSVRIKQDV